MTFSFPSCIATRSNLAMQFAENPSMRLASTPLMFAIACLLPALAQAASPTPLRNGLNRVDFTGDGKRDIWSDNPADALASTAAYLARSGWSKGQIFMR